MIILGLMFSYLFGSIPTAYIFAKSYKGIDIRQHGSGNVGATNVFRVLGKGPGSLVLALDIVKGIIPVVLFSQLLGLTEIWQLILIALAAVAGHNWTVFLRFKGGKGIATSLGVLIGLTIKIAVLRPVLFWTLLVFLASFLATGFVSLSSILASIFLPVFMVLTAQPFELVFLGVIFCLSVVIRHRPNIKRLLQGQEPRVSFPFKRPNKS